MAHTDPRPEWKFDELDPELALEGEAEVEALTREEPFRETEEMELAAELLTLSSEAELDEFLGGLFEKARGGVRKVAEKTDRPLGGVLKAIAKKALPFLGSALGTFIPVPFLGTAIGSALGSAVSKALEMELEGRSDEVREFELSKRFVRLAGLAARQVAQTSPDIPPLDAVRSAMTAAAQQLQEVSGGRSQLRPSSPPASSFRSTLRPGQVGPRRRMRGSPLAHPLQENSLEPGGERPRFPRSRLMHDVDRTYAELEPEAFEFSAGRRMEGEVLNEADLHEMAAELLSVSNEQELDLFLGGLLGKLGSVVGKVVKSSLGKPLGGLLKGVAKKALPQAGAAISNIPAPGHGGPNGSEGVAAAGEIFGLELEGLSQEDAEFEASKQFVRLAADATKTALAAPEGTNPAAVAKKSVVQAIQKHAPGLLRDGGGPAGRNLSGRWVREGHKIILYGV
ncbi:hypothetical protein [Archangium lansingense]|uniref:Uncharacterized protein n=1 Tax=Archangium lansingense TaxID=2995310 RepID=A0ABT3ZWR9_9BACT|nr:hypothetical protein [Archangium lansinium]MCY1073808.1 hypothetical protein [Archangium lansinium]